MDDKLKIKSKKIERFEEINETINLILKKMRYYIFIKEDKILTIQKLDNIIINPNH